MPERLFDKVANCSPAILLKRDFVTDVFREKFAKLFLQKTAMDSILHSIAVSCNLDL